MFKLQYSDKKIDNSIKLSVDYYSTVCKNIKLNNDETGNSFISAFYPGSINQPNIQYQDSGSTPSYYHSKNIFVYGNIHNIPDVDYDGEIVIENIPTVSNNTKLYCCFLVKQNKESFPSQRNTLSKLINSTSVFSPETIYTSGISISLNEYMDFGAGNEKAIYYETVDRSGVNCRVVVFLTVIQTNADISKFSGDSRAVFDTKPRSKPKVISIMNPEHKQNGVSFQEGFGMTTLDGGEKVLTSDGAAGDIFSCEYLPVSTDTAQVFQIPISTDIVSTKLNEEATTVSLYFFISVMIATAILVTVPIIYNLDIYGRLDRELPDVLEWVDVVFMTDNVKWKDLIMVSSMALLSLILISVGVSNKSNPAKMAGIFFMSVLFLGRAGIFIYGKMYNLSGGGNSPVVNQSPTYKEIQGSPSYPSTSSS
jgi:hypothetical protein